MQAVLPLLLLLLLLAVFQSVDLHGLGGPGLPHISRAVGQSHDCKNDELPSQGAWSLHRGLPIPSPCSPSIWRVSWVGGSLSSGQMGTEACEGEGAAQADRAGLHSLSQA